MVKSALEIPLWIVQKPSPQSPGHYTSEQWDHPVGVGACNARAAPGHTPLNAPNHIWVPGSHCDCRAGQYRR